MSRPKQPSAVSNTARITSALRVAQDIDTKVRCIFSLQDDKSPVAMPFVVPEKVDNDLLVI